MIDIDLSKFYENPCCSCINIDAQVCPHCISNPTNSIIPTQYASDDDDKERYFDLLDEYVRLVRNLGFNPIFDKE